MTPDRAEAAHAAILARLPIATARLAAAADELRLALIEVEAINRLTSRSDGLPIAVFVPPVADGLDLTFTVSPDELQAAMTRLAELEPPSLPSATILQFSRH